MIFYGFSFHNLKKIELKTFIMFSINIQSVDFESGNIIELQY